MLARLACLLVCYRVAVCLFSRLSVNLSCFFVYLSLVWFVSFRLVSFCFVLLLLGDFLFVGCFVCLFVCLLVCLFVCVFVYEFVFVCCQFVN